MVGCEEETGAEGLIIREHDCVVAMMSRLGTRLPWLGRRPTRALEINSTSAGSQ